MSDPLAHLSDTRWIEEINNNPATQDAILRDLPLEYETDAGFVTALKGSTQRLAAALKHPFFKKEAIDTLTVDTVHWPHDMSEQPALSQIKTLTFSDRYQDERFRWADSEYDYEDVRLNIIDDMLKGSHVKNLETINDQDCGSYWPLAESIARSTDLVNVKDLTFKKPAHADTFIKAYQEALKRADGKGLAVPLPTLERVNGMPLPEHILALRERVSTQLSSADGREQRWVDSTRRDKQREAGIG